MAIATQYSDETATLLAQQLLDDATADSHIAVVSAPSVFVALKNALVSAQLSRSRVGVPANAVFPLRGGWLGPTEAKTHPAGA